MKIKKTAILLLVLLLAGTSAFAQTGASGSGRSATTRYLLTVNSNVRNSQVFINAVLQKGTAPMRLTLNSGTYNVTVRASGYQDYVANVNLSRNFTLNAVLQPITYALTINANILNATVFVNNQSRGTAPVRLDLQAGRYSLRVEAPGYHPHNQVVQFQRDAVINASLEPITYALTVNSSVRGAAVFVNNQSRGAAPLRLDLQAGQHSLRVEAEGYYPFNQVIQFDRDTVVSASLEPMTFRLNVTSNVQGAEVLLNGNKAGNAPMRIEMSPGQYNLRVSAPGYYEYNQVLNLSEDTNINANLRKQTATVGLVLPDNYLNATVKDPRGQFSLSVDGKRIASGQTAGFEVDAGQHIVRIETGGLAFEAEYVFEAGMAYSLELDFLLLLKPAGR
jgi:hypothetical protein